MIIKCNEVNWCGRDICCGYCDLYEICLAPCTFKEGPEICGYSKIER